MTLPSSAPVDPLVLYGHAFDSRLLLGTARYPSPDVLEAAVQQARPQAPTPAADNSPAPPRPDALSGESRTREAMRNRERGDR